MCLDFVVYPYDLSAKDSLERLRLTIIDFVQDEPDRIYLTAQGVTQHRIPITWSVPDDNQSSLIEYQIQMSTDNSDWFSVSRNTLATDLLITEYRKTSDSELIQVAPNTQYYFRGRTRNAIGWSTFSNVLSVKTQALGLVQGFWELGHSGVDSGIVTRYWDTDRSQFVDIERNTGIAQFTLTTLGGYETSEVELDAVGTVKILTYDLIGRTRHERDRVDATRDRLSDLSEVDILYRTVPTGTNRHREGQISFIIQTSLRPAQSGFWTVQFNCSNPSGLSTIEETDF